MAKTININYEQCSTDELSTADRELTQAAFEATARSYSPYSGFKVGAAARLASGEIITAANCESEVFPSGMCAERSLLYHYASNHATSPIEAMAIASDPSERECYPCGACRQFLAEFSPDMEVLCAKAGNRYVSYKLSELLPHTFNY